MQSSPQFFPNTLYVQTQLFEDCFATGQVVAESPPKSVEGSQACPSSERPPSAPPHKSAPESSYVTPTPAPPAVLHKKRETLEAYAWKGWTLQLEKVTCGKPTCKTCPHGPYWYAYRRQGARLVSKYIGKRLNLENIESDRPQASDRPHQSSDYSNASDRSSSTEDTSA